MFSSLVALALAKTAAADGGRLTSKVPQYEREVPPTSGYVEDSAPFGHLGRVLLEQELAQHENAVLLGLGARAVRVVWNRGGRDGRSTAAPILYEHALSHRRLSVHLEKPDKINDDEGSSQVHRRSVHHIRPASSRARAAQKLWEPRTNQTMRMRDCRRHEHSFPAIRWVSNWLWILRRHATHQGRFCHCCSYFDPSSC